MSPYDEGYSNLCSSCFRKKTNRLKQESITIRKYLTVCSFGLINSVLQAYESLKRLIVTTSSFSENKNSFSKNSIFLLYFDKF